MQNLFNIENFNGKILDCENLSKRTTYKIGGPAKYFAVINDVDSLINILEYAKLNHIDFFIIGGGSNLLVSDEGFDGIAIKLEGQFDGLEIDESNKLIECGCAISPTKIVNIYLENSFQGAEFLCGIPGTLGGAVKMNAGRKNAWISSIINEITILNTNGNIVTKNASEIDWGYRFSSIKDNEIILRASLKYKICSDISKVKLDIEELINKRKETQPTEKPTCGSVFKNPENNSAGMLIEDAQLKGHKIGGAQISQKHANFILNVDNACASDVISLIQLAQNSVYEKFNIKLIPELKFLGFDYKCSLY